MASGSLEAAPQQPKTGNVSSAPTGSTDTENQRSDTAGAVDKVVNARFRSELHRFTNSILRLVHLGFSSDKKYFDDHLRRMMADIVNFSNEQMVSERDFVLQGLQNKLAMFDQILEQFRPYSKFEKKLVLAMRVLAKQFEYLEFGVIEEYPKKFEGLDNILVVDDKPEILQSIAGDLDYEGLTTLVSTGKANFKSLSQKRHLGDVQMVILDNNLGGGEFGYMLIDEIYKKCPNALILVNTDNTDLVEARDEDLAKQYVSKAAILIFEKLDWNGKNAAMAAYAEILRSS